MSTKQTAVGMTFSNPFLAGSTLAASPFAPVTAREAEVAADAPEGSYTYALVKSAPEVPASEVEVEAAAIEVAIKWGESTLHVAHLAPPRSFYVGEEERRNVGCDFFLPAEKLGGATRAPLVIVSGGAAHAVLLPGVQGTVEIGGRTMSVAEAIGSGACTACVEVAGAHQIALPMGSRARLVLGDLSFEVSAGHAGRAVAGKLRVDRRSLPFTALSMALHLGLLGTMAVLMPPMAMADEGGPGSEQHYLMAQAFQAMAEREPAPSAASDASPGGEPGGPGASGAPGESGSAGNPARPPSNGRLAIDARSNTPGVQLSRAEMLATAGDFGVISLINAGLAGDPNAPSSPWGALEPVGSDAVSRAGNLWGQTLDEAGGAGGLSLSGIGEGSNGNLLGVGVGAIGTIHRGNGGNGEHGFGPGGPGGRLRGHTTTTPRVRVATPSVSGRVPAEVIQRIVRQNSGRFRACYEAGLRGNPNLAGRVGVAFVIGRDGAVSSVQSAGSDLPDAGVVSCVVRSFYGLSFPAPEVGIVTVSYPISFSPG
jgi:hypothetical protein